MHDRLSGWLSSGWGKVVWDISSVVFGILIAFGLNAWWENRTEERGEQVLLKSLSRDFTKNRELMKEHIERHQRVGASADLLLGYMASNTRALPGPDSLNALIGELLYSWMFNPVNESLDAAVATGKLDLLDNDELKRKLAAWKGTLQDASEEEYAGEVQLRFRYLPYLVGHKVPLARLLESMHLLPKQDSSVFSVDYQALFSDVRFESHVAMRRVITEVIQEQNQDILADIEQILELIGQEIR